ncbi:L,D-transpeptidase [Nocardioides flavescens]|uniref:L,D-transpeptidase family protein n=1 Tax=Nocardioides flavescens TaxID=2691959 RepID=A0A6L7EQQ4_9ACTN|nr:L,D-transpeptidase [Nocardioides flavescens]MXG89643.1 L,D-transpeptidase family protein [Nocardioides flavescens]
MSRHRAAASRPLYGRMAVLGTSASVTAIAVLGSLGVLPSVATGSSEDEDTDRVTTVAGVPTSTPSAAAPPEPGVEQELVQELDAVVEQAAPSGPPPVPAGSGEGRRVVFDQSDQRVWLVRDDETVARTYLVSGSLTDNLRPGTFEVFSRSAHATGIEDSGTMRYFVRFTHGTGGSAIGFHDIPVDDGAQVQTTAQLGTPQSHGCIRQARKDALAMWGFAPVGTRVDVVA